MGCLPGAPFRINGTHHRSVEDTRKISAFQKVTSIAFIESVGLELARQVPRCYATSISILVGHDSALPMVEYNWQQPKKKKVHKQDQKDSGWQYETEDICLDGKIYSSFFLLCATRPVLVDENNKRQNTIDIHYSRATRPNPAIIPIRTEAKSANCFLLMVFTNFD